MEAPSVSLVGKAKADQQAAIIFVHGFSGSGATTWNSVAPRVARDPRLGKWDCWTVTYATSWLPDIKGIWSADADLEIIAQALRAHLELATLARYDTWVLIAHSMGGLVVQKALVDNEAIVDKTRAVILFGTPSGGLRKASPLAFWKPQLKNMAKDGKFIPKLRDDWKTSFGDDPPFSFLAVAGEKDQFVPPQSSIDPFPKKLTAVVAGNHLTMLDPSDSSIFDLIAQRITVKDNAADIGDSALRAVERGAFSGLIRETKANAADLDDAALVRLAIALDKTGKRDEARKLLQKRQNPNSDVLGAMAGRLKRNWLFSGRLKADAEGAKTYYAKGYDIAKKADDLQQAYYHGINLAFLSLVFDRDQKKAKRLATEVLAICERVRKEGGADEWVDATEGDANLILGAIDAALKAYGRFLDKGNDLWKVSSTYLNARTIAADAGDKELGRKLGALFGDSQP
jgi:predicted alpha/beta hydrolase family esterase